MSLLEVRNVSVQFGGLKAVNNVDFAVNKGEILSVIGPNGAGKTTLFNAITGVYPPTAGAVHFQKCEVKKHFTAFFGLVTILASVLSGIGVVGLINIEEIWQRSIVDIYQYRQAFDWSASARAFQSVVTQLPAAYGTLPFLVAAGLSAAGIVVTWQRSRRCPEVANHAGISRTFQNIRLFPQMSVLENVLVGMDRKLKCNTFDSALRLPAHHRDERDSRARALEVLRTVELDEYADLQASKLSYGHQRRLEIARALASEPELLLLDEPAAGMNPSESVDLMRLIRTIRDGGVTVLLIEHHMRVVMEISDRVVVLDYGNKIAEGTPDEVRSNPAVIKAYLGDEELG